MGKKKKAAVVQNKKFNEDEFMKRLTNGLVDVLGMQQGTFGTQLNQTDTLFRNNRNYLISNMRQLLSEIYVEHGLVSTIVDVPVDDGLRGGVKIISQQLSPKQIKELETCVDRDDDLNVMGQALKWCRLFGGGAVVVITDQDFKKPLNIKAIKKDSVLEFRAVDLWELYWDKQNDQDRSLDAGEIENFEHYNYYGQQLHKSRVFRMKGLTPPSFVRPKLRGWGYSVVESLVNSINQYLKANNLIFEVLDEFKVDIFKIKNLASSLTSAAGEEKVKRRVQLANQQKNFQNAITMDAEDDFMSKELTFTGIAETMTGIRMQVASDMRMPITKLFGVSAAGFNSGEDDIENYNSMVESQVRQKSKYHILRMLELKCQKEFGFIPDDLSIEFKPLRVMSAEAEENVKTSKFNRLLAAKTAGEMSSIEFREACNAENLLIVQLDDTSDVLDADYDEAETEDGEEATEVPAPAKVSKISAPEAKS